MACSLVMDPVLDFGCIAASSQVISKTHHINNAGSAPGVFHVQYNGDPSIKLSPCNGVLASGATQCLKVELHADRPMLIEETALVKLQNGSAAVLSIRAKVMDQHLEVFDQQGVPLSCLWFGPVYYGTSRVENVVLRNNSPQACDWVCLHQNSAAGAEVGTHILNSTNATLLGRMKNCSPATQNSSQVLLCVPKEGSLGPAEQTTVAVCFSPLWKSKIKGWRHDDSASRQDYSLFLLFESVGTRYGFTHALGNSSVELAVTGSGLPVSLVPRPSKTFNFLTCGIGECVELLCVLHNQCSHLPVSFHFRKIANFSSNHLKGTIHPGQCQDVVLSFTARQPGSFHMHQILDVLGHVVRKRDKAIEDPIALELCSFHTVTLHLSATCHTETTHPVPQLNPGITPQVSNPTGLQPHVRSRDLALCRVMARGAVLNAENTRLHVHNREMSEGADGEDFLAFPNDRASSIRHASDGRYRTIFTNVRRYHYVDPNYAFTEEEDEKRRQHRQIYLDSLKQFRQTRLQRIKERRQREKVENHVDIGMVPSHGLVPPTLRISDMEKIKILEVKPDYSYVSLAVKHGCKDLTSTTQQVKRQARLVEMASDVLNAVPTTRQEVSDCKRILTAQELYQVHIGPLFVDFGIVCVHSMCVQKLELINNLSVSVWVQFDVDCSELQGSSPLSHILSPHSHSTLPLTFQSEKLGHFYKPVYFSVNQHHPGQIMVKAKVIPLALELSKTLLVLPYPTLLGQSGFRTSVTLRNRLNHAAEFTWRPVVTEGGILFSIRPATGVVEPYRELDCEVVWHSSFSSPTQGDFDLCVHENTQRLHCTVKIGSTNVKLAETQIAFRSVPLNMPSVRTAVLHNTGQNHAFFQVRDVCPMQGMVVSPPEGVVPRRGQTALQIHFNPDSVFKFDTRVEIALRGMKSIEIRVIGSVEPPNIDISVPCFQFRGVYVGSKKVIPFALRNVSSAPARVTYDLSEYTDFTFQLPEPSARADKDQRVFVAEVQGKQTVDCSLVFSPSQAASYDFDLPLTVNGVKWPTGSSSPFPTPSSASSSSSLSTRSRKNLVKPQSVDLAMPQSPRTQATVLFPPLEMIPSCLRFHLDPLTSQTDIHYKTVVLKAVSEEHVFWRCGDIKDHVNWWFDGGANVLSTEDGTEGTEVEVCTVTPSSGSLGPGQSICLEVSINPEAIRSGLGRVTKLFLPLYLGDKGGEEIKEENGNQPYRELSIINTHQPPCITIHPPQILLTPAPIGSTETATLTLLAQGYPGGTNVSAEVDEVVLEDGTKTQPISVVFIQGNNIPAKQQDQRHPVSIQNQETNVTSLTCHVSFCSTVPLSVCTTITFIDHLSNRFKVKLCAVAENCMLTVWPAMTQNRYKQQIVLMPGATAVEAILQRCQTSSHASGPISTPSSAFDHRSSTNKWSESVSFQDSYSLSGLASMDTSASTNRETPTTLGVPEFPAANSAQGIYHQNVLLAVERWFSLFGWPGGPHPISVPHTLRRLVTDIHTYPCERTYRVSQNKDSRSVVDMLIHLTGKNIPGIPHFQTFSSEIDQRSNQLIQQHEAMLAFLRVQGAYLGHIKPEYLLDIEEFKHWSSLQPTEGECGLDYSHVDFESLSKRAWTDVLMQIYKVLVFSRVSESNLNTAPNQENVEGIMPFRSQTLASNIYSSRELHLLSWLNTHYQSTRKTIWTKGCVPSARWIVNFDLDLTDGLVLAALLAAYCPYLICSHFRRMYTTPSNLEQILHNNIIVSKALTSLCLNLDIQPTEISDPNPVQMLMLCVHLYDMLPQYLPRQTITLSGRLHTIVKKEVRLKSPSSSLVKYQALLLGENAHLFSLPGGSAVSIPPKAISELTIQCRLSFLQSMEAFLLLISGSPFGQRGTTLAFRLKTHVSHLTPTNTVKSKSPCYQLKEIQVPITNPFNQEAQFSVVLVESQLNPLVPENDNLLHPDSFKASLAKMISDKICGEETKEKPSDLNGEDLEFLSLVKSVYLKSHQSDTLNIDYLPFCPGIKHCTVLLTCPQVGDVVFMVKATAELPIPSPLSAKPSSNILATTGDNSSVWSLCCKVGQVCEEVLRVPLINMAWEEALAIWGQRCMTPDEHRRRVLTYTLHSSTVRATTAAHKLLKQQAKQLSSFVHSKEVEYSLEVSLPQYFTLPSTVKVPVKQDINIPWENPADCGFMEMPLRFKAPCAGQYKCQVVLSSFCDTRLYIIDALVSSQGGSAHLDFTSLAHRSVTQNIPLYNETEEDWKIHAEVCGEGFSGPKVIHVLAGTRVNYPLTFMPSVQCSIMGKLTLHNRFDGKNDVFTLRGVGEPPLPVDHVVLHCPVGQTTRTQLDVPNFSQDKLTLEVVTDLSVVSGAPSLEIKPGQHTPYALAVSPWKRGKQIGCVKFVESDDTQKPIKCKENTRGHYEVHFSLEIICEPAAPVRVIDVQCATQTSVAIDIPVNNPKGEPLLLDVYLEGEDLSGAKWVSIPPGDTVTYRAIFSPGRVGKIKGSVLFQSDLVGEFWYQLELYVLPPPVITLPQACCQLGKWTRQNIPMVNPTSESLKLHVTNSNPRNFTLEMDPGSTLILEPHSSTQLGVRFNPSSIGELKHMAKITFTYPELQEWCVLLSGCGLNPESEEPLSISSPIGSNASITIPFTNPTESPVVLDITIKDEDPSGVPNPHQVPADNMVFSIPLSHTEGIQINEGAGFDVPVVFAPNSVELQQAWLCITMKPLSRPCNYSTVSQDDAGSDKDFSTICWTYPLRGIPTEGPVENPTIGTVHCEAGCQLEMKVDLQLAECVLGNQDRRGQEGSKMEEDFLCKLYSDSKTERSEVEDWLSASIEAARRDPETGMVLLTLRIVYAPLEPYRYQGVIAVQCVSGDTWEFPITLVATEAKVDDVILIEACELGKTSSVGFRLTSTIRRPEPFTAVFLPGSSEEFRVTPGSGLLPAAGSPGALVTVSFTPTTHSTQKARLIIQSADMQWVYEVKGETRHDTPTVSTSLTNVSSVLCPVGKRRRNFVTRNLRFPAMANCSPLKICR